MSSFEPSRIPAWLAPVCDERSGSHSTSRCDPSSSQRASVGAEPTVIACRSTGRASPSISRKSSPGTSVLIVAPVRLAIRLVIRSMYVSSSFVPISTSITTTIADATSAVSSAHQKFVTVIADRSMLEASISITASRIRAIRKPEHRHERDLQCGGDRVQDRRSGSRSASAVTSAPPNPSTETPGTSQAATSSPAAAVNQPRMTGTGR